MARSIAAALARVRAKFRERSPFSLAHDLIRKPVRIPDQVEDMLFGIMRPLGRFREADGGLEGVAAGLALPQMADAAFVDQFRPFRHEQAIAALRAFVLRAWVRGLCGAAGVKVHGASSDFLVAPAPNPAIFIFAA